MKLVLCESQRHFEVFKEKLWEKDKDVSEYIYGRDEMFIRGLSRDTQVIRLGSFKNHPNYEEILGECQFRFDMSPRRNSRVGHGPTPSSSPSTTAFEEGRRWGRNHMASLNGVFRDTYAESVSNLIPDGVNILSNTNAGPIEYVSSGEMVMNPDQQQQLHAFIEPNDRFTQMNADVIRNATRSMSRELERQMLYEESLRISPNPSTSLIQQISNGMRSNAEANLNPSETLVMSPEIHHRLMNEVANNPYQSRAPEGVIYTNYGRLEVEISNHCPSDMIYFRT